MRSLTWFTDDEEESKIFAASKWNSTTCMELVKIACTGYLRIQHYSLYCTSLGDDLNISTPTPCPALYTRAQRLSRIGHYVKFFGANGRQERVNAHDRISESKRSTNICMSISRQSISVTKDHFIEFKVKSLILQKFLQRRIERKAPALSIQDRMAVCADFLEDSPLFRVLLLYEKDFEIFKKLCQHTHLSRRHTPKDDHDTAEQHDAEAIEHIKSLRQSFVKEVYPMYQNNQYVDDYFMQYYKDLQYCGIALICNFIAPGSITVEQIREALGVANDEDRTLPLVDKLNVTYPVDPGRESEISAAWGDTLLEALKSAFSSKQQPVKS